LYCSVLSRVSEDLVLTLEDDVEPPLDAVRQLGRVFGWGRVGAVGAACPWAGFGDLVCAGTGEEEWGDALLWSELPGGLVDVGCVGGGCTMWARWALRNLPVQFCWDRKMGWDAMFCRELRRHGFGIKLHGGVRCVHHTHGRLISTPTRRTTPRSAPAAARSSDSSRARDSEAEAQNSRARSGK
jgi:hypothetical protein